MYGWWLVHQIISYGVAGQSLWPLIFAKEWTSFHLTGKKLGYLDVKDFLNHECVLYLKQALTPPHRQVIYVYHTLNHRFAIEIGWWSLILISRGNILRCFCSYNVVAGNEAHFVLKRSLYSSMRVDFCSLFHDVVLGSLKSIFSIGPSS